MSPLVSGRAPLVSVVLIGRNDDFRGDYLYRLGTSLSFLAQSARRAGLLDEIEVLVVDWASERPLAAAVALTPAAARITTFLHVTTAMLRDGYGTVPWRPSTAVNVGVRRARGTFVLFTDADCLWTEAAMTALQRLVCGDQPLPVPLRDVFCYVRRYQVPWATVQRRPRLDEWARLCAVFIAGMQSEHASASSLGGFSAGHLMHRELWHAVRGYDESLDRPWGWADNDLMFRVSQNHAWLDVGAHGLFGLHMEHQPPWATQFARDPSAVNPMTIRNVPVTNGPDWGIGDCDVPAACSASEATPVSGTGFDRALTGQTAGALDETWRAGDEAAAFVRRIGAHDEKPLVPVDQLSALAHIVLADLPTNLYWFGPISPPLLLVVLKACPAAEVYFVNPWPDGAADGLACHPGELSRFLEARCRFRGWARIVQGDPTTAWRRIQASRIGDAAVELAWIAGDTPHAVVRDVASALAPGGIVLCSLDGASGMDVASLRAVTPGCVTQRLGTSGLAACTRPL